jgi:hypothetical protein
VLLIAPRSARFHEATIPTQEFLDRRIDHIREPYQHGVRHFGLPAPRAKATRYHAFWRLLGQIELGPVHPLRWAEGLYLCFGVEPLVDSRGNPMTGSHSLRPPPSRNHILSQEPDNRPTGNYGLVNSWSGINDVICNRMGKIQS